VIVLDREATILEAAQLLRRHHVCSVVVTEERDGILTDQDIIVELLAEQVPLELSLSSMPGDQNCRQSAKRRAS
jgi:CBS domain-containing protein